MKIQDKETLKEIYIKLATYLKLKEFCDLVSTECMNKNRQCEECNIDYLMRKLKEEIFLI